jgi:hypothetical protein
MAGNGQINLVLEGHGLEDGSLKVLEKMINGFASLIPQFAKIFSSYIALVLCEETKHWFPAAGLQPAVRQPLISFEKTSLPAERQ